MVHVLLRTRKPSSQSREQDDHGPQEAQPPLRECGDVLPLRRRSSTRAAEGRRVQRPQCWATRSSPRPPGLPLPGSPPLQAVPSVSQAPVPSAGQVLVSVLLLPNCRPCGSGSGARHVKRKRCSWRAPPWVTFTGSQGVQGVLRRTSGQASGLHVLNSFGMRVVSEPTGFPAPRATRPTPRVLTTPQPGQELPFSQTRRRDCTPPPQLLLHLLQEPQEAQKMGTGQGVFSLQNLGRKEARHPRERYCYSCSGTQVEGCPDPCLAAATGSSPLLPALAHADAAPVAGRRVAATSLTDLKADSTGRAALCPR